MYIIPEYIKIPEITCMDNEKFEDFWKDFFQSISDDFVDIEKKRS